MALVVPNEGEERLLDMLVDGDTFTDARLRLYKNDFTPDQSSVYGDFTQADFSGYAQTNPAFGAASIVANKGKIVATAASEFTHNGGGTGNTLYGYYYVDSANNVVLWAERFAASQLVDTVGDKIKVTLAFTANSEN